MALAITRLVGTAPADFEDINDAFAEIEAHAHTPAEVGAAAASHAHLVADLPTVTVAKGGTGATDAATARANLGVSLANLGLSASAAELNYCKDVTSAIQTQLNGKAASSHGTHVPTPQSANNAIYLRNDNSWQTITPAEVGAANASHAHAAGDVTSGTLPIARGGTGVTTAAAIGLLAYPVGAIYMSLVSTSPQTLFGGTWVALADRFLLGAGAEAAGAVGGSVNHVHAVTGEAHIGVTTGEMFMDRVSSSYYKSHKMTGIAMSADTTEATTGASVEGDTNQAYHVPPYIAVYMWRRTA